MVTFVLHSTAVRCSVLVVNIEAEPEILEQGEQHALMPVQSATTNGTVPDYNVVRDGYLNILDPANCFSATRAKWRSTYPPNQKAFLAGSLTLHDTML